MAMRHVGTVTLLVCLLSSRGDSLLGQDARERWAGTQPMAVPDVMAIHTADEPSVLLRVVKRGPEDPWGLAFLPGGDMPAPERPGRLRAVLDPTRVAGDPEAEAGGRFTGLRNLRLGSDTLIPGLHGEGGRMPVRLDPSESAAGAASR